MQLSSLTLCPCFEAWDVAFYFVFFFSFIVLLPVLSCGRWIRYHCLGCSPVLLVHHTAFPSLPLGLLGHNGRRRCTARDDRCSSSKKAHQSGAHISSPVMINQGFCNLIQVPATHQQLKFCSGISRLFIFLTLHSACGLEVRRIRQYIDLTLSTVIMRLSWD